MTFVGMDPAEVQGVAARLQGQGEALRRIMSHVDALVSHASHVWPGHESERFRTAWYAGHRRSLENAAHELSSRVAWLHEQVGQQEESSGAGGGSTGLFHGWLGGGETDGVRSVSALDDLATLGKMAAPVLGPLGLLGMIGANRNLTGRYTGAYGRFLKAVENGPASRFFSPGAFRYKQVLNGFNHPNGPLSTLEGIKTLGAAGKFFGVVAAADDGVRTAEAIRSGDANGAVTSGSQTIADGMKMVKNPAVYLGGVLISTANEIGTDAASADFSSEGFRMVWDYSKQHPLDVVEEFGKSIPSVLGRVL